MTDADTIRVYAGRAEDYANCFTATAEAEQRDDFQAFVSRVPSGGRVLDLGCGPGHWAARLRDQGLRVDATDATLEMADLAQTQYGIDVRVEPFEALEATACYDGIWANFSLLHAPQKAFPGLLARIRHALRPGGVFHIGMKLGDDEARDDLGRFYSYYSEADLRAYLSAAGFTVIAARKGRGAGLSGNVDPFVIVLAHA